jgi:hypothetical protein
MDTALYFPMSKSRLLEYVEPDIALRHRWNTFDRGFLELADAYMAYLACAISGAHPDMLPVTDREMAIGKVMVSRQ